jgi:hypothetical protein
MAKPPRILVITAGGPYPWIIINALSAHFGGVEVALEQPESKALFLKRRARKIGWWQTGGQFLHHDGVAVRQTLCPRPRGRAHLPTSLRPNRHRT